MRILYFSTDYTTHDRRFLAGLSAADHEVFFLRLNGNRRQFDSRDLPGGTKEIECPFSAPTADFLTLMPRYEKVLKELRPDAVQAGPIHSSALMTALSGFHPWIAVSWGSDLLVEAQESERIRWASRFALRHADWFLCDCDAVRETALALHSLPPEHIVQFPWGINPRQFGLGEDMLQLRRGLGWEEAFVLLSTRSFEAIYDHPTLLRAFAAARKQENRLRLILLGDGSQAPELQSLIDELGIRDEVHLPGRIQYDDLPHYFRAVDLYLTATLSDGTSISLLEAMASQLPVVVTDNAGNREWVKHGENGWLAAPSDSKSFTEAILNAAGQSPEQLHEIGRRSRMVVETRADWDRNFSRLLDAYDQMQTKS